jgi:hypothetical protein
VRANDVREETRRKLDSLVGDERRLEKLAILLGVGLSLLSGLYFIASNTTLFDRFESGQVQWSVWRVHEKTGQRHPSIQVMFDNGHLVRIETLEPILPAAGSRVLLRAKTSVTGFTTYSWEGFEGE